MEVERLKRKTTFYRGHYLDLRTQLSHVEIDRQHGRPVIGIDGTFASYSTQCPAAVTDSYFFTCYWD